VTPPALPAVGVPPRQPIARLQDILSELHDDRDAR
jgi:hypothetical protein